MTYEVDKHVRQCTTLLGDNLLVGKLNTIGDMIVKEAKHISIQFNEVADAGVASISASLIKREIQLLI